MPIKNIKNIKNFKNLKAKKSPKITQNPQKDTSVPFLTPVKIIFIVGTVLAAILFISLIAIIIQNSRSQDIDPHVDIVLDTTPYAFFENHYILDQNLSPEAYQRVLKDMQSVILEPSQLASAPTENNPSQFSLPQNAYDALIHPDSFVRRTAADYKQLDFAMTISDGRAYDVSLRAYGSAYDVYYYGLILRRTDSGSSESPESPESSEALNTSYAFIAFLLPGDSAPEDRADYHYDRDTAASALESWLDAISSQTLITKTTDL